MTPQEFVAKWRDPQGTEKALSQSHFIDLCHMLGVPAPTDEGTGPDSYTFEKGCELTGGSQGWADVWRRRCFAWEYKGPDRDLRKAYDQLLGYHEALENPPILVVCDLKIIEVHTKFQDYASTTERFTLDDLLDSAKRDRLRLIWLDPIQWRTGIRCDAVTAEAAAGFAKIADALRAQGVEPQRAAHFLIRLLFCLFAEDVQILPNRLFAHLLEATKGSPEKFQLSIRQLFGAMSVGGMFGFDAVPHVDGRLFDDDDALPLSRASLRHLAEVAQLDWSAIEPAIFGTLFVRSLDPAQRAQLGAQYTSKADILLVVEPVLMAPLRRRWVEVERQARDLAARRDATSDAATRTRRNKELESLLLGFMQEIATIRILDPACGSGNFLYVSLLLLLGLWKEVWALTGTLGLTLPLALDDVAPTPLQLHGIEINPFAHELAQVTIWIGYIQWLRENGFGTPREPILKPIESIVLMDAILAYDADEKPVEPEWPEADVIVGNPPFLGRSLLRTHLGDRYVDDLFALYARRLPKSSDLCCYWFERGRGQLSPGGPRVGLLATQAIRSGKSRTVLERIKASGDIFFAESDRPWNLDGASVRVSMVGFDDGCEARRVLDGVPVARINADLTSAVDVTGALKLQENRDICARGTQKRGPFDIDAETARRFLQLPPNPNGRPNSDVVVPLWNGLDVTGRPRGVWVIDFGPDASLDAAAMYEAPFEYVRERVRPIRMRNRDARLRNEWWLHGITQPAMRERISHLTRYCATTRVAKHRLFVWLSHPVLPDDRLYVFAREDDYFFGALHSRVHEVWSLATGSRHGDGSEGGRPTYDATMCFETFAFPWPPGQEPLGDPRVIAIGDAARELVEKRDLWLNPEGATYAELKKRTLTNLYNARPTWLDLAHRRLDDTVFDAYGWPHGLSDEEILERLLALNLERAARHDAGS